MLKFPFKVAAISVTQPLGTYYVAVLPASLLLDVAYSDALSASHRADGVGYELTGTQRLPQPKRLQPIAEFINRTDSAFPNSIILAANVRKEDGLIEDEDQDEVLDIGSEHHSRWTVEEDINGGCGILTIPTPDKLAAIIDGQHRLFAFASAHPERLQMELICSVFLDLPKPYQAQLFATINSTQKPVDKSLTYELFGYNIDEESEEFWSPDKLAVFLTRRIGTEDGSPLKGRIVIAPKRDFALERLSENKTWKVSTAVVVEGIMRLFTTNPKRDGAALLDIKRKIRKEISESRKDKSPLRKAYLENEDIVIYQMTLNYLRACASVFWDSASPGSFIVKTVGIQALFDILRTVAAQAYQEKNIGIKYFAALLEPAKNIDFAADAFRNASGSGRSAIRKAIAAHMNKVE
ncbi:DGQHR domain-containing protein [Rugamonas sp. FT82W]|uniref:DGQHR domain-containing protein n=2 Tax=Duganella vulcania TaxID=2692166 RepID=A0A845G4Q8_9BURK|nr:DGQHR domain-containing protein [Duganella vulcania]